MMDAPAPRRSTLLNGNWNFSSTDDELPPAEWSRTCPVPALVDCATPRGEWRVQRYHWYQTSFDIESALEMSFIIIEQAMFGTDVWLNGVHLGGDIACYTSQEYDAGRAMKAGSNILMVRVGRREDLPPHSAVGNDLERSEWIPGIWGDVYLRECGNPRIKHVQVIPHIDRRVAEVRVTVANTLDSPRACELLSTVHEKRSGTPAGVPVRLRKPVAAGSTVMCRLEYEIPGMHLWSVADSFLYELQLELHVEGKVSDRCATTFGMREFKISGSDFFFNGKRIYLKGGNIAFHRFLSDADRRMLPWNPEWIKRILVDIPKAHNFNFFRNHIGQMYNRWYDIADEHGMLLQNEWMFWTTRGSKEQITKEFTRWVEDNCNHPSIIIWDALNECSDTVVQSEIIPEMKALDPSRPWESVDFVEEHPYIYSLGPVLNERRFGFTRAMSEVEHSARPAMLNEFCWWWLDKENNPSSLMKDVIERWLGPAWSQDELIAHQSFLVTELVELFRRKRVDAIQPFVYLSNNAGPTANWFLGNIRDLHPKPVLSALKNAFAPFGVSIELWERHFFAGEKRTLRVFVFNDEPHGNNGRLQYGIRSMSGEWLDKAEYSLRVRGSGRSILPLEFHFPQKHGEYRVCAELHQPERTVVVSEKPLFVFDRIAAAGPGKRIAVFGENELEKFLRSLAANVTIFDRNALSSTDVVIVSNGELLRDEYQKHLAEISSLLESGKTIIIDEPEFGIEMKTIIPIATGVQLTIEKRNDVDKGGYDSYVFATDPNHALWSGIGKDHLKMFNGGFGGELVSEHHVVPNRNVNILSSCGLGLRIPAVFEVPVGNGKIIVSRLQLRGRLKSSSSRDLYARREDPVAQRYLLNLLAYAGAS